MRWGPIPFFPCKYSCRKGEKKYRKHTAIYSSSGHHCAMGAVKNPLFGNVYGPAVAKNKLICKIHFLVHMQSQKLNFVMFTICWYNVHLDRVGQDGRFSSEPLDSAARAFALRAPSWLRCVNTPGHQSPLLCWVCTVIAEGWGLGNIGLLWQPCHCVTMPLLLLQLYLCIPFPQKCCKEALLYFVLSQSSIQMGRQTILSQHCSLQRSHNI